MEYEKNIYTLLLIVKPSDLIPNYNELDLNAPLAQQRRNLEVLVNNLWNLLAKKIEHDAKIDVIDVRKNYYHVRKVQHNSNIGLMMITEMSARELDKFKKFLLDRFDEYKVQDVTVFKMHEGPIRSFDELYI